MMNDYEARRTSQIARNKALLAQLNIPKLTKSKSASQSSLKRKSTQTLGSIIPSRKSARLARRETTINYWELGNDSKRSLSLRPKSKHVLLSSTNDEDNNDRPAPKDSEATSPEIDAMRTQWSTWEPVAPLPTRNPDGDFHFESHPHFTPNKSPMEVMQEGAFGGSYWRPLLSLKLSIMITEDWRELPSAWIAGLDPSTYLTRQDYDPSVNKYGVKCGQTIEEWERNGWINHHYDVRGWFQWYCRYFQGRRCDDDDRQIQRWINCAGRTGRWRRILLKKYVAAGIREVSDEGLDDAVGVSPAIHQTLHHWGWEVRQDVLDRFWEGQD